MSEIMPCEYRPGDVSGLKALWARVFGDPPELIDGFFRLLPEAGSCFVCEADGAVAAMSFILTGLKTQGSKLGYIYAVATNPKYRGRGLGAAVVRACVSYGQARGCASVCLRPAEASLFKWYADVMDALPAVYCADETAALSDVITAPVLTCEAISPADYNALREKWLSSCPHVTFPDAYVAMEELICRVSGGGLCRLGDSIAAFYPEDGRLLIRELLCADEDKAACIRSLLEFSGCASALINVPDKLKPFIAAAPADVFPDGCRWGPALD